MRAYSVDLRKKIVQSVRSGISKSEAARRFGVNRSTVKRYLKRLDEDGPLAPERRPGKRPKLDKRAVRLLEGDLEARPWAAHRQRSEFLFAVRGVKVGERGDGLPANQAPGAQPKKGRPEQARGTSG